jgi:hypothetical protein
LLILIVYLITIRFFGILFLFLWFKSWRNWKLNFPFKKTLEENPVTLKPTTKKKNKSGVFFEIPSKKKIMLELN